MPTKNSRAVVRLRKHLNKGGNSLAEFAEEVGVSIFAVRKWLSSERVPRDQTRLRIAQVTKNMIKVQDWIGRSLK